MDLISYILLLARGDTFVSLRRYLSFLHQGWHTFTWTSSSFFIQITLQPEGYESTPAHPHFLIISRKLMLVVFPFCEKRLPGREQLEFGSQGCKWQHQMHALGSCSNANECLSYSVYEPNLCNYLETWCLSAFCSSGWSRLCFVRCGLCSKCDGRNCSRARERCRVDKECKWRWLMLKTNLNIIWMYFWGPWFWNPMMNTLLICNFLIVSEQGWNVSVFNRDWICLFLTGNQ